MAFQEEDAKILVKLGLTISEAKVYLSLLKFGQTTGKALKTIQHRITPHRIKIILKNSNQSRIIRP